jgi:hypothetical protein
MTHKLSDYVTHIPEKVPAGKVLVHNQIVPVHPLGLHGFRAWVVKPSKDYEVCLCGWAPKLPEHYRCVSAFPNVPLKKYLRKRK